MPSCEARACHMSAYGNKSNYQKSFPIFCLQKSACLIISIFPCSQILSKALPTAHYSNSLRFNTHLFQFEICETVNNFEEANINLID